MQAAELQFSRAKKAAREQRGLDVVRLDRRNVEIVTKNLWPDFLVMTIEKMTALRGLLE